MCVTTLEARLSKTRIGVWDILHPDFGYRHVLAYQNNVQNLSDGANCMLLHIPGNGPLEAECIINTENDLELLVNMETSILGKSRNASFSNHIVEMGVYHIALLNDLSEISIQNTLQQIPQEKRPELPKEIIAFYNKTFPGLPLALCCFNNKDAKKASPILLHFDPKYPDTFMFNTLDSHGGIPDLNEKVVFHQTIITGSYQLEKEGNGFKPFNFKNVSENLLAWLPKFGTAVKIDSVLPNRDLLLDAKAIQKGGDARFDLRFITEN